MLFITILVNFFDKNYSLLYFFCNFAFNIRSDADCDRQTQTLQKHSNMVKHIILWTLNPELSAEEKANIKKGIKEGLEGLAGKVTGLTEIKVNIDGRLDTSNCDVMLDSTLESPEALAAYAKHPAHVEVADTKVRPYTIQRTCLDYEI